MRLITRVLPAISVLVLAATACHDLTKPRPQSPLAGVWELTTHFDTFSFETAAPSPPDCPNIQPYCTHYRTVIDAPQLSGLITVQGASSVEDHVATSVQASGTLQASFCDSIDYEGLTGCVHLTAPTALEYAGSIEGAPDGTTTGTLDIILQKPGDDFGLQQPVVRTISATFSGDSIYGPITWGISGRSPPTYHGTFVMRRAQ